MPVRRLFLNPLWLIVSLPGYIGLRLLPALSLGAAGVVFGIALLATACVFIPLSIRARSMKNQRIADRLARISRARRRPPPTRDSTCSSQATLMAANSGHGIYSLASFSPSLRACID
jgi:hypothetical protein